MGDETSFRPSHTSLFPAENLPQLLAPLADMLHEGAYDKILAFLEKKNNEIQDEKGYFVGVLAVAIQICRSCLQLQTAVSVHAQAQANLTAQEEAGRRELWRLLQLLVAVEENFDDLYDSHEIFEIKRPSTQSNWINKLRSFFRRKVITSPAMQSPEPAAQPECSIGANLESGPAINVYCLGAFRVYNNDTLITKWPGVKCQSIFKYLIVHRQRPVPLDVLMDLFWRGDEPETARRNLYQAIYLLRQALQESAPTISYVISADGCYGFNPDVNVWLDAEDFERLYANGRQLEREGKQETAVAAYESAAALYNGSFFAEDLYETWMQPLRERLHGNNLNLLERLSKHYFEAGQLSLSITYAQKILSQDNCHEPAHRRLMTAYAQRGQRHLALRQYHQCAEALQAELDATPSPKTAVLYEKIKKNQLHF